MTLRIAARAVLPFSLAVALCLPGTAQNTQNATQTAKPAPSSPNRSQPAVQTAPNPVQTAPNLGASTSLNSKSNDLASLYGKPVEQIVARVNDRAITNSDLKRAKTQIAEESRQQSWSLDQYEKAKKNLLRDLIDQQLLLSKGKQLGITGDTELIKRLDKIRKKNHLASMNDLEKAVEQQGISYEDFKQNIRNGIVTQLVVQQQVGSKMQISQADIKKYYRSHLDRFTHPESVELSEILIPTSGDATDKELGVAKAKAERIYAKLKAGGNFADLAKEYSGGPAASQGGKLGNFKRGSLAKVLEEKTFDLPPGGYTKPIRTRQGYIILKVTAHRKAGTSPMQKVEPQIQQAIYLKRIQPAMRKYLTLLREQAYIDIRPGYTDTGASPNETKPTYAAYVAPKPEKKEKKVRFVRERRHAERAAKRGGSESASHKPRKIEHQKLRYGRPPLYPVSAYQTPVASNEPPKAASSSSSSGSESSPSESEYVQPLGPDLEHAPKIHPPKQHKWRMADLAKRPEKVKKAEARKHRKKEAKQAKETAPKPTPPTPAEKADRKVQNRALGLGAGTAHKKKTQKKAEVQNGEKTRFSHRAKDNGGSGSENGEAPASGSTSSPQ